MVNKLIVEESEKEVVYQRSAGLVPWPLIMDKNQPYHITFLVGTDRALKKKEHFDPEKKRMFLCRKIYGEECKFADEKTGECRPTISWNFLVCVHDFIGKLIPNKDENKEPYEQDPLRIFNLRMGENAENFTTVIEAERFNELITHPKTGEHQVWQVKKSVNKKGKKEKTSYPAPKVIEKYRLGDDFDGVVPEEILARVPELIIEEDGTVNNDLLLSWYLWNSNLTQDDWDTWGLVPPMELKTDDEEEEEEKLPKKSTKNKI